jgi:signal transduction histidine kinase
MLEQIAMNLAVNARDAMPNGGQVSISTSLETIHRPPTPMDPEQRDGDYLCLTFSDTGTGMDTQILSRIFEPFFTTKPVGKGTGFTNTPATNSLPDMNTNVPASTNQ